MILIYDNFDSFTYNLVDYFQQLGVRTQVLQNDQALPKDWATAYSGIVLSPGPGTPLEAGLLIPVMTKVLGKLPLLGVCLGHQALAQHFGGKLVRAIRPMHGKQSLIHTQEGILFTGLPNSFQVVRYHSLIVKDLPKPIKVTAKTTLDEVMAIEIPEKKACGIQFHPEALLTEYGMEMLNNWLKFYNIV